MSLALTLHTQRERGSVAHQHSKHPHRSHHPMASSKGEYYSDPLSHPIQIRPTLGKPSRPVMPDLAHSLTNGVLVTVRVYASIHHSSKEVIHDAGKGI